MSASRCHRHGRSRSRGSCRARRPAASLSRPGLRHARRLAHRRRHARHPRIRRRWLDPRHRRRRPVRAVEQRPVGQQIEEMVKEVRRSGASLPFKRYVFLNVFRQGGGGLEHANSTLLTSSPKSTEPTKGWLSFVAHEYFHAFNVKRIRPVELGPFDYEHPPRTTSLWFSEGGTTYYGNLMLARAGLHDARRLPRRDVLGDRVAAESTGTLAAIARAVVRRSVDEQQFRRWRERDDGELLRQGQRRFVPARRAHPPDHGRQEVDG